MKNLSIMLTVLALSASVAAGSITYVDDFEAGANASGWNWNGFGESQPPAGGNPGGYLKDDNFFAWPKVESTSGAGTPFSGDYRAAEVSEISFDILTSASPFGPGPSGAPTSIALWDDDLGIYAYTNGLDVTDTTAGWQTVTFNIPSQVSNSGWTLPAGGSWDDLIVSVDRVSFHYLTLDYLATGSSGWDVGMDNASITYVPEPGTLCLLALGGFALIRRRR